MAESLRGAQTEETLVSRLDMERISTATLVYECLQVLCSVLVVTFLGISESSLAQSVEIGVPRLNSV